MTPKPKCATMQRLKQQQKKAKKDAKHAAAAAATAKTAARSAKRTRKIDQLSTAEYAANAGRRLASDLLADPQLAPYVHARTLIAQDFRGIHLFADPDSGAVYAPDELMGKFIDPRPLSAEQVAQLGMCRVSTGLVIGPISDDEEALLAAAAAAADDDDLN